MKKDNNTFLIVLAIIAALLAAFNAYVALQQVTDLATITGYQVLTNVSRGNVTLIIPQNVQVEFNPFVINWSNGSIIAGRDFARLTTTENFNEQVHNGTWPNATFAATNSPGTRYGLVVRNAGNINVSVNLTTRYNSTNLFDNVTTGTGQVGVNTFVYLWNISNNNTIGVPPLFAGAACGREWNFSLFENFTGVNKTGQLVCQNLSFAPGRNALRIDVMLVIPQSVPRKEYTDTITATAEVATR